MKKYALRGWAVLTFTVALAGKEASAATLSEMRVLNATQKPGMMVLCEQQTAFTVKGLAEPVRTETRLLGRVLRNDGDRMVFQVTHTMKNPGAAQPFLTEKFRLTTTLEQGRQKMELDPASVAVSLPFAKQMEVAHAATLRENRLSYADYNSYRIRKLPDYDILPAPDIHDSTAMHCTTRHPVPSDSQTEAGKITP
ncbi:hypothetical protein PUATCC27989T_01470 [Phytobacter ursingii]|nr:hypothetical protein PUATCC27989T_01470 [Phytobacter ursingii]